MLEATSKPAEAVFPLPASFDVTALVVLFKFPEAADVTLTVSEQDALAGRLAAERITLPDPASAVIVPLPQLPLSPLGVATVCPVGRVSVKPIPLRERPALGFDRLNVSVVVPFNATLPLPYALAILGGITVGGGCVPDDPPPQARLQKKLVVTSNSARRDVIWKIRFLKFIRVIGFADWYLGRVLRTPRVWRSDSSGETGLALDPSSS